MNWRRISDQKPSNGLRELAMKVLLITRKFPPAIGGMEQFSAGLAKELGSDGRVIAWGGTQFHLWWWIPLTLVRGCMAARTVDLVHIGDGVLVWLGVLLKWLTRKPVSITVHGLDLTYHKFGYQHFVWSGLRRIDRCICVSASTAQLMHQHGIAESVITVIPNGIHPNDWPIQRSRQPLSQFSPMAQVLGQHADAKILLTVGRLIKRKGVPWFITNVMPILPKNMFYIVAGSGLEQSAVAEAIAQTHSENYIFMLGRVSDESLQQLYNAADVFIMPNQAVENDQEGFGMVALEAAVCGTPVVAADREGIRAAVIDGQTGYLVESYRPIEWKQAILKALEHPLSPSAVRKIVIEQFGWQRIGKQYRILFNQMIR